MDHVACRAVAHVPPSGVSPLARPQGTLDHAHGENRRPAYGRGVAQVSKVSLGPQASGDDYGRQHDVTGCAGIPDLRRHPRMPCGTGVVTSSHVELSVQIHPPSGLKADWGRHHVVSTPTDTPTSPIPGVFVGVRRPTRNARTCRNSTPTNTDGPIARIWGSSGRRFKSCQPDDH